MLIFTTYGFLYLSIIALWIPKIKKISPWWITLGCAYIFGLLSHRIQWLAIVYLFILFISANFLKAKTVSTLIRILAAIILFVISVGLETHILPGFNNLRVMHNVLMSPDAIPFNLYLNFDKTLVGIVILGLLHPLMVHWEEWVEMFKIVLPRFVMIIAVVGFLAFLLKFVRFDPKLSNHFWLWALTNLLFVCVAEEALFRGFIQKYLCQWLQSVAWGDLIAVIVAAILFGLAHFGGGIKYVILASIAGLGYGWVYLRTKRIEASIITHFFLNLLHFLFFTYPALASAFSFACTTF